MEQETIIIVSCFGVAAAVLLVLVLVLFSKLSGLRKRLEEIQEIGFVRVQKLKLENDKNHAFHNPAISPDEELARRGFSMYSPEDVESGRGTERYSRLSDNKNDIKVTLSEIISKSTKKSETTVKSSVKDPEISKQTGGQFVEELSREIDYRHQRQAQQQQNPAQQNSTQQNTTQQNSAQQQSSMPRQQNSTMYPQNPQGQQQNQQPPPFLLQSIEENKRRSRSLANPVANAGRASETNPNFIY